MASSAADRNTPTAHNRPQRNATRQPHRHYARRALHRPSASRSVANPNRHRSSSLRTEQNRRSTTQTLPTERNRHGLRPRIAQRQHETPSLQSRGAAPNSVCILGDVVTRFSNSGREGCVAHTDVCQWQLRSSPPRRMPVARGPPILVPQCRSNRGKPAGASRFDPATTTGQGRSPFLPTASSRIVPMEEVLQHIRARFARGTENHLCADDKKLPLTYGGRGGIRTPGAHHPTVFKTAAFGRSATLPELGHANRRIGAEGSGSVRHPASHRLDAGITSAGRH